MGIVQRIKAALHLGEGVVPVAPASPEGQQPTPGIESTRTTIAPGAPEAAQGAQTAAELGKPLTAEILNQTAQAGIETTVKPAAPEAPANPTPPEAKG